MSVDDEGRRKVREGRESGARRRTHYLRWSGYCFVIGMVVVMPVVDVSVVEHHSGERDKGEESSVDIRNKKERLFFL